MSNCIQHNVKDEIAYLFLWNGATAAATTGVVIEVWRRISDFIPHITRHLVTFPRWDLS